MLELLPSGVSLIDVGMWIWFVLTAVAVASVAYDQFRGAPQPRPDSLAMATMRWGWLLFTLYTGLFGFIVYWSLHRAPVPATIKQSVPSIWEQSIESTVHCVAGDATGILAAVVVASWLRPTMGVELIGEYFAGFAVGLLWFQALCMKSTFGGEYWRAVRGTFLPEMLSMNAVMAGMIPVMIIVMSHDMSAMQPTSVRFWATLSLAVMVSTVTTFPVNWWLVERGLKHGTGGEERARLRDGVSGTSKWAAVIVTLGMLVVGIILAARFGNFAMRAGDSVENKPVSFRVNVGSPRVGPTAVAAVRRLHIWPAPDKVVAHLHTDLIAQPLFGASQSWR